MTQVWLKCPEMDHEEWLQWRRNGVGASDAPAIMGVSPWTTRYQKWEEKVFPKEEWGGNAAMERGKVLEDPARKEFERLMGVSVPPVNVENKRDAWLRASLDGLDALGKVMVEIKCPNSQDHSVALSNRVPDKYYPQCQHQLAVTGLPGMYYFSFDGEKGTIVEVARDDLYIRDELFPKEKEFWNCVVWKEPPPFTDRDYCNMEENAAWLEVSRKWKEAKKVLKDVENVEKLQRDALIALSKDRNAKGAGVSLSKSIVQGRIDYVEAFEEYLANMKAHYPDVVFPPLILDPYRKDPWVKWTLRDMD
jgi:putative phage-type endonuclease